MMNARTNHNQKASAHAALLVAIASILTTGANAQVDTHINDVTFQTADQPKWLPANEAAVLGPKELFGGTIGASASDIQLPSISQDTAPILAPLQEAFEIVGPCFYFVDVGACTQCVGDCGTAAAECVGDCGGAAAECTGNCLGVLLCTTCPFQCIGSGNPNCIDDCCDNYVNNCRSSCSDVKGSCESGCNDVKDTCETSCADCQPLEVCLADVIGAEINDISVAAGYSMFYDHGPFTATTNNDVDVTYPARVAFQSPTADTFAPGDTVTITTGWEPRSGASLATTSPDAPIRLTQSMFFNANIDFELCGPDSTDCEEQSNSTLENISDLFSSLNFSIPESELFTITSEGEGLCDLDPSAILCYLGLSGDLRLPNINATASSSTNGQYCINTGPVTDRFVDLTFDIDSWIAAYLCPPCKVAHPALRGFVFGFGPISIGAFTLGVQLWDWDMLMRFDETNQFQFCGDDIDVDLDFGSTAVAYEVKNSSNVVVDSGTDSHISLSAGEKLEIVAPNEVLTVSPDFTLRNTYTPEGRVDFLMTMDMEFLSLTLAIPEFKVICDPFDTDSCVTFPYTDLGTLGPVIKFRTEDDPTDSPVVDVAIANIVVQPLGIYDSVHPFELGGFNNPSGAPFQLNPQQPPVLSADANIVTVSEGGIAASTGAFSDPEGDAMTLSASIGAITDNQDGTWSWSLQTLDGPDDTQTVYITADDGRGGVTTISFDLTVNNVAPDITSATPTTQLVHYGDTIEPIVIEVDDVAADTLVGSTGWAAQPGLPGAGIPPGLTLASTGCTTSGVNHTCGWTITGQARLPEGVYNIVFAVSDDDGATDNVQVSLDVRAEGATIDFDANNPAAWEVEAPRGDSGPFSLFAFVEETLPDSTLGASTASPGDIGEAAVQMTLVPVGPGGSYTVTCTPVNDPVAFDYDGLLEVRCDFDDVAVNTYTIEALLINGGSGLFYTGFEDDTLTIFDPSLGFATGGGNFIWPGFDERTNFGFTVEGGSRKKTKGSLLVMRKLADGTKYRIKSNAMTALAIGQETDFAWAAFEGKCTYQDPTMPDPIGNHEFIVYAEDHGTPGRGYDRFWIQVFSKDGRVIAEMSFYRDAETHAATIAGGNVVVPH